jgi:hypothetical protein
LAQWACPRSLGRTPLSVHLKRLRFGRKTYHLRPNQQRKKEAASELAAIFSMNAGRAFDRDISRGSTGDPQIDND